MIRILAIGDIVGTKTLELLSKRLWGWRRELQIDFVVANGENATEIHGICARDARLLLDAGTDLITLGNHTYGIRDIYDFLDAEASTIIRPANYPPTCPGCGYAIRDVCGYRLLCININGTVFMEPLDNPFTTIERILEREQGHYDTALLDIHAEATSEKLAIARKFDGKIGIMFGTHTHVATADEQVLPNGSGYITDLGMSGPEDGILGTRTEAVLCRMQTHMPAHFTVAEGELRIHGAVFEWDPSANRCRSVRRVTLS